MLDVVNLQDLAKEAMLDFANLMFLPKGALLNCANVQELAKGAPPSSLSIYLILPRERCWISTGTCQGSDAGFRQFTRTCKGSAALNLVNLRDLAKGTMLAFCQSTRPCQGSDADFLSTSPCQRSGAGFCGSKRTCQGSAALALVNQQDLDKGEMLNFVDRQEQAKRRADFFLYL